jgi:hypothetical protein
MIVVGNPAVLMNDKHWLALLLTCQQHGACTGQPMPDLSEAAAAAAAAGGQGQGGASSSSAAAGRGRAGAQAGSSGSSSNLQMQGVQLEKLVASITLSQAADEVAMQQLLLQEALGLSGLVDEAGGGMVRHE